MTNPVPRPLSILLVLSNAFRGRTFVISWVVDVLLGRGHRPGAGGVRGLVPSPPAAELPGRDRAYGTAGVYVDDQILGRKADGRPAYSVERDDLLHHRSLMDACDGVATAFSTMVIERIGSGRDHG